MHVFVLPQQHVFEPQHTLLLTGLPVPQQLVAAQHTPPQQVGVAPPQLLFPVQA